MATSASSWPTLAEVTHFDSLGIYYPIGRTRETRLGDACFGHTQSRHPPISNSALQKQIWLPPDSRKLPSFTKSLPGPHSFSPIIPLVCVFTSRIRSLTLLIRKSCMLPHTAQSSVDESDYLTVRHSETRRCEGTNPKGDVCVAPASTGSLRRMMSRERACCRGQ